MKSFDDIKNMWQQQEAQSQQDVAIIMANAKKSQHQMNRRMILESICLLLVIILLVVVMLTNDFKMATTFIGLWLMIICIFVFALIKFWQYRWLKKIDLTGEPKTVLMQMEHFYEVQKKVNTKWVMLYSALLNIAFAFYFIETMSPLSTTAKIFLLLVYTGWMLFAVFVLGKRSAIKEQGKTEIIIAQLKEREEGLSENL